MARLSAALVCLVALVVFAADTSAMHHPSMGTWAQRDPGQGDMADPVRVGQYRDGMNLYQYAKCNPPRHRDPSGLQVIAPCHNPPDAWSAIAIDFGITAGMAKNPEEATTALKVAALIEFLASVPQSPEDLIGGTVESVASGGGPTGGFPEATVAVAEVLQKIMKQRAFFWVKVWCLKCECDKDSDTAYAWHPKHTAWYRAENVGVVGLIQEPDYTTKSKLDALKQAATAEAKSKANELCSKTAE